MFCSLDPLARSTRPGTMVFGPQLVFVEWVSRRECRTHELDGAGGSNGNYISDFPGKASGGPEREAGALRHRADRVLPQAPRTRKWS